MSRIRRTAYLLNAISEGAEIREKATFQPVTHMPRRHSDPAPWAVYEEDFGQHVHVMARDLIAVWPDGSRTCPNGGHPICLPLMQHDCSAPSADELMETMGL